jgi:O-antigen ligase
MKSNRVRIFKSLIFFSVFIFAVIQYLDLATIQRFSVDNIVQNKGSDRLIIWNMAMDQFRNAPLCGIGIGSFQSITLRGVHNQFLIVLVETGIIGFLLYAISLIYFFKKALRSKTSLLAAVLIGTCIVIFFLDAYNKKFFWNAILISIIIMKMEKNNVNEYYHKVSDNLLPYIRLK